MEQMRSPIISFILPFFLGAGVSILGIRSLRPAGGKTVHAAHAKKSSGPIKGNVLEANSSDCDETIPLPLSRPRVLLYTFCTNSDLAECSAVADRAPRANKELYWKACYAQRHRFDLVYASPENIHGNEIFPYVEDRGFWMMVHDLNRFLTSGRYDYVYLMRDRFSISDAYMDLPVWAYDSGHNITLMDQPKNKKGFRLNGILFKPSVALTYWFEKLIVYQSAREYYLKGGEGALLEMILATLGSEAESRGQEGYRDTCLELACLSRDQAIRQNLKSNSRQIAAHSQCFFAELDRLAGPYGLRNSKLFGFSKANVSEYHQSKLDLSTVLAEQRPPIKLSSEISFLPLTDCFDLFRTGQYFPQNCFGLDLNDGGGSPPTRSMQECPLPDFAWTHLYSGNDLHYFRDWSQPAKFSPRWLKDLHPPRVLIYTWCSQNSLERRANEVHWKACYAHAHGYDIVFSDVVDVTGVAAGEEAMWAWYSDILRHLFSGKYDCVFVLAANVLLNQLHLEFPVWAYDMGHDITLMDQNEAAASHSGILLKPTSMVKDFLETVLENRRYTWTLGGTGAWMETLLVFLGRDAEMAGRHGYRPKCLTFARPTTSDTLLLKKKLDDYQLRYTECFFRELDRLAGPFGNRNSPRIGFTKTVTVRSTRHWQYGPGEEIVLRKDMSAFNQKRGKPWANCFLQVRQAWPDYQEHCFAYHWDEDEIDDQRAEVSGECPDTTFDWKSSQWNRAKRNLKGKN